MDPIIYLQNISKRFRTTARCETLVLDGVSLEIFAQQSLSIAGESGSGKSTLLGIVGALDVPTSGHVFWKNQCIDRYSVNRRAQLRQGFCGFVFQNANLIPEMTAIENVLLPVRIAGGNISQYLPSAQNLLEQLNVEQCAQQIPEKLSGGERQRIAIARALILKPEIVIADEPTGNLDEKNASVAINLLLELCRQNHSALLLVTHNVTFAKMMDTALYLKNGKLVPA